MKLKVRWNRNVRFWISVGLLFLFAGYSAFSLIRAHFHIDQNKLPQYDFYKKIPSIRGGIYCSPTGRDPYPIMKSMPCWDFRLDPVAMTQSVVKAKGQRKPRSPKAQAKTIADVLGLPYGKVLSMVEDYSRRYQRIAVSDNRRAFEVLSDRSLVGGIIVRETYERRYLEGNRLCHVVRGINGTYNALMRGTPGEIRGKRDAHGNLIKDKIEVNIPPKRGADVHLTVDHFLQKVVEGELSAGVAEYGAGSGWCVILEVDTGRILAMATVPGFDVKGDFNDGDLILRNKVISHTYEPGSVMKVITAASAVDAGFVAPDSVYSTKRDEKDGYGRYRYYRLPNDSHAMPPRMTVKEGIVESSNIVIGKLGCDFGPKNVYAYFRKFGFGSRTGIELPDEEGGILRDYRKWDKATWSRAPIGQGVSVTALQLASAYQTIANGGVRKKPYIVDRILDADGNDLLVRKEDSGTRVISEAAAYATRDMMLGVAAVGGTARRAKLKGYSVAGKTGTAQKPSPTGGYAAGLYVATFCGIVPSGVVKRNPEDPMPVPPEIVVLVSLDFDERRPFHQGGNSAGPIFKRIAETAMRYLEVAPDRLNDVADDEF